MDDKKEKCAYWMRPSMVAEMEEMLDDANATSKSDFVCKAVAFYIGYLRSQKNMNYLAPVLSGMIKSEIRSVEKNMCETLFNLAVEQAMNSNLIAAYYETDPNVLDDLRSSCARKIAATNGIMTFEDAYAWQKGDG